MDRMMFGRKSLNAQRPRVDRFVAPRDSFPEIRRRVLWPRCAPYLQTGCDFSLYQKRKRYMKCLDEAFSLEPLPKVRNSMGTDPQVTWPCVPRKKPYLSSSNSILLLDLPTYSSAPLPELLDWSSEDILVAALGSNYHMWSWRSQNIIRQGFTQEEIYCCKFDPKGELLLLGTAGSAEVHNSVRSKWISGSYCDCNRVVLRMRGYCYVTAIDWSPTGNSYVTGCSRGVLKSCTRSSKPISSRLTTRGAVLTVKVSPDARFVAAAAVKGDTVEVLTWPELTIYSRVSIDIIRALAWHPWRSALLGIGNAQTCIGLWDAHSLKQSIWDTNEHFIVDSMLFSHRTGELVLSLWVEHTETSSPTMGSVLMVMSEPGVVVDQWDNCATLDRVRAMVFSPDGTKLATATAEEDLIIYNFLEEDKNAKNKKNYSRFSKLPVYLDEAVDGYSLR